MPTRYSSRPKRTLGNRVVPSRAKVINSHALIVPLIEKPRRDAEHPNLCAEPKIAIQAPLRNGADSDGRLGQRHRSEMLTVETRQTFGGGKSIGNPSLVNRRKSSMTFAPSLSSVVNVVRAKSGSPEPADRWRGRDGRQPRRAPKRKLEFQLASNIHSANPTRSYRASGVSPIGELITGQAIRRSTRWYWVQPEVDSPENTSFACLFRGMELLAMFQCPQSALFRKAPGKRAASWYRKN